MRKYQIYTVGPDGSVSAQRTIDAQDDAEAIFAARSMQRPLVTEVWYGDRRIARIGAAGGLSEAR